MARHSFRHIHTHNHTHQASIAAVEGEDALRLEGQGVLEKYGAGHLVGSKWQKRYVKCQRDILEIHHYKVRRVKL